VSVIAEMTPWEDLTTQSEELDAAAIGPISRLKHRIVSLFSVDFSFQVHYGIEIGFLVYEKSGYLWRRFLVKKQLSLSKQIVCSSGFLLV
jgi:hypothetical protein